MTKWLIDSKVEDIHKKMPWRDGDDDGRKEQQQADSVVDDLGQMFGSRSEEEVEQGTSSRYPPFALCVWPFAPLLYSLLPHLPPYLSHRAQGDRGGPKEVAQGSGLATKQVQDGKWREPAQNVPCL